MRPLMLVVVVVVVVVVTSLLVAAGATGHQQLRDPNVIATEPERADTTNLLIERPPPSERAHNSTTANRGLLCQSAGLLEKYCKLSSLSGLGGPVCASDGRLYASVCELARATCRQSGELNLCRLQDESWCRAQQPNSWCSHSAYQLFKLALWREFNSSATLLFEQLDQNRDGQLEARELWPKLSAREYDDPEDQETSACDQMKASNQLSEFAFERHFHWSPCSLSHLLVHEDTTSRPHSSSLSSARRQLTRAEFVRLFGELEKPHDEHTDQRLNATTITSEIIMQMGDSKLIDCLPESPRDGYKFLGVQHCAWTRHGVNLASIRNSEPHVSIVMGDNQLPRLRLVDAQLYLSGIYRCSCYGPTRELHQNQKSLHTVHLARVQVLAQPYVSVRPKFQWSLPNSRVAFECQHDQIDTSDEHDQVDDQIEWLRNEQPISKAGNLSSQSERAHHRLVLERVQLQDSGQYTCQVNVSAAAKGEASSHLLIQDQPTASFQDQPGGQVRVVVHAGGSLLWSFHENGASVFRLQLPEDGQELELVRELSGQSRVSEQVDGNWNQLTLCGGLTPEQVVICEWSDNAILVEVAESSRTSQQQQQQQHTSQTRKYIYIGQPNLNRVLVFDGRAGELVAVVATEPQPRRLFAFKPNKIHLSKWVRRRLGPLVSLRWLQALEFQQQQQQQHQRASSNHHLQAQAHPLKLTPKSSRLYSDRVGRPKLESAPDNNDDDRGDETGAPDQTEDYVRRRFRRHLAGQQQRQQRKWPGEQTNTNDSEPAANSQQQRSLPPPPPQPLPRLVQYDIWLLCYGKPLLVDAQSDLSDLPSPMAPLESRAEDGRNLVVDQEADHQRSPGRINRLRAQKTRQRVKDDDRAKQREALHNQSEPTFTPWPRWASLSPLLARQTSKEARLRNRKSVQIIQSTFLPVGRVRSPTHHHHYNQQQQQQINASGSQALNEFKRLTVLTTHHVIAGPRGGASLTTAYNELERGGPFMAPNPPPLAGIDLVQDLCVPERPHSQATNPKFKLHHAYVTHYAERQLYRVAMDTYRYDREIDLHQCDPLALVPAVQGLLIVQCRAPITHQLNGQLVLDELTSVRVQFNAQIKAQQAHLTPDSRYLVSILANESNKVDPRESYGHIDNNRYSNKQNQQSSVIYVQSVRVAGLKFMYEIKTSLEVAQCSFVWRDGYYAAIFVALNRRDQQTELLSLRLADGRLELIARVPGLAWSPTARHREPLNVNQELQLALLTTSEGLYLIDLEENRVIQGVHDHNHRSRQSSLPTLLWV